MSWLITPDYFAAAQELLTYGVAAELITGSNWRGMKNKDIYSHFVSTMPQVSVEQSRGFSYERAWKRVHSDLVEPDDRDNLYLLVHNKLPTPERMERIKVVKDGFCVQCPGSVRADLEHLFCSCEKVSRFWAWIRQQILKLSNNLLAQASDWEMINLLFPKGQGEEEICWLLCWYLNFIWREFFSKASRNIKNSSFFGFLKFKFRDLSPQVKARLTGLVQVVE